MINYLVTIGVPVYNVSNYIERCSRSLFEQTYNNIEYIFVNDQTPDDSIEILKKVIKNYPQRRNQIKILNHNLNKGLAATRNTTLSEAKGEFIIWIDSDDWIDHNTVTQCVECQQATNADIVSFGLVQHFPKYDKQLDNPIYDSAHEMCLSMIYSGLHHAAGRMIRTTLYHDNNIVLTEGVNMGEDYQQTPKLAYFAKKVATIPQNLYHYNCLNEGSYTANMSDKNALQLRKSHDIVCDFFRPLGGDYLEAINKSEAAMSVREILRIKKVTPESFQLLQQSKDYCQWLPLRQKLIYFIPTILLKNIYIRIYYFIKNSVLGNVK